MSAVSALTSLSILNVQAYIHPNVQKTACICWQPNNAPSKVLEASRIDLSAGSIYVLSLGAPNHRLLLEQGFEDRVLEFVRLSLGPGKSPDKFKVKFTLNWSHNYKEMFIKTNFSSLQKGSHSSQMKNAPLNFSSNFIDARASVAKASVELQTERSLSEIGSFIAPNNKDINPKNFLDDLPEGSLTLRINQLFIDSRKSTATASASNGPELDGDWVHENQRQ